MGLTGSDLPPIFPAMIVAMPLRDGLGIDAQLFSLICYAREACDRCIAALTACVVEALP